MATVMWPSAAGASVTPTGTQYQSFTWIASTPQVLAGGMTFRSDGALLVSSPLSPGLPWGQRDDGFVHVITRPGQAITAGNRLGARPLDLGELIMRRGVIWSLTAQTCPDCPQLLHAVDPWTGAEVRPPATVYGDSQLTLDPLTDDLAIMESDARRSHWQLVDFDPDTGTSTTLIDFEVDDFAFSPDGSVVFSSRSQSGRDISGYDRHGTLLFTRTVSAGTFAPGFTPLAFQFFSTGQACLRGMLLFEDYQGNIFGLRPPFATGPLRIVGLATPPADPAVSPVVNTAAKVDPLGNYVVNESGAVAGFGCRKLLPPPPPPPPPAPPTVHNPASPPHAARPGPPPGNAALSHAPAIAPVQAVPAPAPPPAPPPGTGLQLNAAAGSQGAAVPDAAALMDDRAENPSLSMSATAEVRDRPPWVTLLVPAFTLGLAVAAAGEHSQHHAPARAGRRSTSRRR